MSKYNHRLTFCDRDCAGSNHCHAIGGVQCPDCGMWYCPDGEGDEDGRCDDCAERYRRQIEEEEEIIRDNCEHLHDPYENYIEPTDEEKLAGMV